MRMYSVDSKMIREIGHDGKLTLRVVFSNGATWEYDGVSTQAFDAMRQAESVGRYFHAHIKNAYQGRKVE